MILLFALNIVLLVTIDWRPQSLSDPEAMSTTGDVIIVMSVVCLLILPLFIGMSLNVRATWTINALYAEKKRLYKEKNKMYVRKVFDFVQKEMFEEAIDVHNDLVFGEAKVITRGVLIGALFFKGGHEDHKRAILNMNGIVEKEM